MTSIDTILPPTYSKIIFYLTFLMIGTFIYALYKKYYLLALCGVVVFLTSINYWRKPTNSWQYYIDIITVRFGILYHIYRAYMAQYMVEFYAIMFVVLNFYPLSVYCKQIKNSKISTFSHCIFHIMLNIACVVLYSGKIL
jgi:hypothetical protein